MNGEALLPRTWAAGVADAMIKASKWLAIRAKSGYGAAYARAPSTLR